MMYGLLATQHYLLYIGGYSDLSSKFTMPRYFTESRNQPANMHEWNYSSPSIGAQALSNKRLAPSDRCLWYRESAKNAKSLQHRYFHAAVILGSIPCIQQETVVVAALSLSIGHANDLYVLHQADFKVAHPKHWTQVGSVKFLL